MTLIEDPKIKETYEEVRNDKSEINWMLLGFINDKADVLEVKATGSQGLEEFITHLEPTFAGFGFVRVPLRNDDYSERTKFVFVVYCGTQVKIMRKAKLSIQKSQVQEVIKSFSIELNASEHKDLDPNDIIKSLKRAGGANYDRQSSDY
ncbi:actin depolymerizing protein [Neoconidiobolus thromboides FSU 785]|nr:actin depolymerizing protein [Neoconidiobolus thromboides FSU 785]